MEAAKKILPKMPVQEDTMFLLPVTTSSSCGIECTLRSDRGHCRTWSTEGASIDPRPSAAWSRLEPQLSPSLPVAPCPGESARILVPGQIELLLTSHGVPASRGGGSCAEPDASSQAMMVVSDEASWTVNTPDVSSGIKRCWSRMPSAMISG